MAQFICGRSKDDICILDKCSCDCNCGWVRPAEAIYNAGYRKLPEDSVVLSREEYEKLKSRADNKCRYDCDLIDMPDFEREKTLIEKTSKEMVEKIVTFLDDYCDCDSAYLVEQLKEYLAKEQFGVEIKE